MTAALVTVHDRIAFTATVSPEQAAAYVRRKLPGWTEFLSYSWGDPHVRRFTEPGVAAPDARQVEVPARVLRDYAVRMREVVDALVALGCADRPSEVLRGMAEEGPQGS